ncbi:MAG TPA: phosphonate ABC transporter ATP-binding protein [Acidisphaera sp.]|nr:phosphonate ABC transporter ATP-binding protein [Acidisphaera sp.]
MDTPVVASKDAPPIAGTADAPLICARDVGFTYPTGRRALERASVDVRPGELVAILGANGSGKSTLLRCIAGMLRPSNGTIHVAGRDITTLHGRALRDARMAMGMVFQHANLVKRRSVLANVMTGTLGHHRRVWTALGGLPACEREGALARLDDLGLREFAPQRAGTLSGGQAQRLSIARALAQRPLALLADEPVASLDPEAAEEVMRLIRRVAKDDGLGVLCVLHQPVLARKYADRIVGLRDGWMQFDSAPAGVTEHDVNALYPARPIAMAA